MKRPEIETAPTDGYSSRDLQLSDYMRKNSKQLVGGNVTVCQIGNIIFACEHNSYYGRFVRGFMKKTSNGSWNGYDWILKKRDKQRKREILLEGSPNTDPDNSLLSPYHIADYVLKRDKNPQYQKLGGNFAPIIESIVSKQEEKRRENTS